MTKRTEIILEKAVQEMEARNEVSFSSPQEARKYHREAMKRLRKLEHDTRILYKKTIEQGKDIRRQRGESENDSNK